MKKLEWNVYLIDSNTDEATVFNVFNNYNFNWGLKQVKKEFRKRKLNELDLNKKDYAWFSEEIRKKALYSFWGKFEYEVIISSKLPTIPLEEVNRIKNINLDDYKSNKIPLHSLLGTTIDIYSQLRLNWDTFIKYILENFRKIKIR